MLDGIIRKRLEPWLDRGGRGLSARVVSANAVTVAGFLLGLAAAFAIVIDELMLAFILICANRVCNGLDGAVARATEKTDFGGFLDVVLNFAFRGLIPLAFILSDPYENGAAGGLLLLAIAINGASFLAFAVMAEKRGLTTEMRGAKSLHVAAGLVGEAETLAAFLAVCLLPHWFCEIAVLFALACFSTTLSRLMLARAIFRT